MRLILFVIVTIITATPVQAQDTKGSFYPADKEISGTRIEVDDEADVIRFFIAGEEKARLDAAGLHVRDNIGYGGLLTDYGESGFDKYGGATGGVADEK